LISIFLSNAVDIQDPYTILPFLSLAITLDCLKRLISTFCRTDRLFHSHIFTLRGSGAISVIPSDSDVRHGTRSVMAKFSLTNTLAAIITKLGLRI